MPRGFEKADLSGALVRLRPNRAEDANYSFPLLQDDRVLSQLAWDGPVSLGELATGFQRRAEWFETGEQYSFAIEGLDGSGLVGSIGLTTPDHPLRVQAGYWLGVPFWGRGYMTDAVRLATHFAFQRLDAICVYARVFVGNIASRRVLEKNGFRLDGTLRCYILKRGVWMDAWFLSLLRAEWEAMKEHFSPSWEDVIPIKETDGGPGAVP